MTDHDHDEVLAKVTGPAADAAPVPAEVVADRRNTLGRNLGMLTVAMLILFFSINGYIQSARNYNLLKDAAANQRALVVSNENLTTLNGQLRRVIENQAKALIEAGLNPLPVPTAGSVSEPVPQPTPGVSPRPGTAPRASATPRPRETPGAAPRPSPNRPSPRPSPSRKPSPRPSPTTGPLDPLTEVVCDLLPICPRQQRGPARVRVPYPQQARA